jgi:hypothetical protein
MRFRSSSRMMLLGVLGAIAALTCSTVARASDAILPGWDLFQTTPGTTFGGAPFIGVPLGTFDFGGTIGVKNTGLTDTIVHRLNTVGPGSGATPIEMVALQLESAVPIDFGGNGLDNYFITLQSVRGGPISNGNMNITIGPEGNPHGTFDSLINVAFDVRKGALNGAIVLSDILPLTSTGTLWSHIPIPGEVLIDGVNHNLNGTDISNDFQVANVVESHPTGAQHFAQAAQSGITAETPEPGSFALFGAGAAVLFGFARRRRKKAA